ncbi:RCC1 domain-containing protein [Actinosynnema sp. ALI-1.44]|uniref:RCC1 domain-containing protein n=1 Tax=Actinosynnema sp. ALI-1.44 TaxID=1933779 RepID=UPI000A01FFC6
MTGEVVSQAQVAAPGSPLSITQHGTNAYVLNHATGTLQRIDGTTEQISSPASLLPAASDNLALAVAPNTLYAVDTHSGTVAAADPHTLAPRDTPQLLAAHIAADGLAVDDRDRLWTIDHHTGELAWLTGRQRRTRPSATGTGAPRLTVTLHQPALVDPARGIAELLDPDTGTVTRTAQPNIQPSDTLAVSGSPDRSRLLLAIGTRGTFNVCAFDTTSCGTPVTIGAPGDDLGAPVEASEHAVVPNYSTGQVTIIDLATTRVVAQRQLFDQPGRFELLTRDGIVFFNDPNSNRAGVLDLAGSVRTITKHNQPRTDSGVSDVQDGDGPSQPNHDSTIPGLAVLTGIERKPVSETPRRTDGSTRTPPAEKLPSPAPTVSIVVKPRGYGYVGDEFELALVVRPATSLAGTRWWFGDGAEATGTSVRHRWSRPGTFRVRAAAVLAAGGQPSITETRVIVDPAGTPPRITHLDIQRPTPVVGERVRFSADVTANPDTWIWTITRPGQAVPETTSHTAQFRHTFLTPGTYTVTLAIAIGTNTANLSQNITVTKGEVKAWGNKANGVTSVPPEATSGVTAIDAGGNHSVALKADGSVIAWGYESDGQSSVPPEATSGVTAIDAGGNHSLALKADGSVIAWGNNVFGQVSVPPQAASGVTAISAGPWHSLALKADGSVIAWGNNDEGQVSVPPQAASDVAAIDAGGNHSLALKADGSVIAWGNNDEGQVSVPPQAASGVTAISAEGPHSLALKADGSIIAWGYNQYGQISVPPQAASGVTAISAGVLHSLALKADGSIVAWGADFDGQISVPPEAADGITAISAGGSHSLAY